MTKTVIISIDYDSINGNASTYKGINVVIKEDDKIISTMKIYSSKNPSEKDWHKDWDGVCIELEDFCAKDDEFVYEDSWYFFEADSQIPSPRYNRKIFGVF